MSNVTGSSLTYSRFSETAHQRFPKRWRWPARLLWGGVLLTVAALFIIAVVSQISQPGQALPPQIIDIAQTVASVRVAALYLLALDILSGLIFLGMATAFLWRKSDNWMAMLVSLMLATFGIVVINRTFIIFASDRPALRPLVQGLTLIGYATFVWFIYTFPAGRFDNRLSKVLAVVGIAWFFCLVLFGPYLTRLLPEWGISLIVFAIYAGSPISRWNALGELTPAEWQQMKWIMIGLLAALFGYVVFMATPLLSWILPDTPAIQLGLRFAIQLLLTIMLTAVPVTIGVAVMRYRLWDADFLINRGLVYGLLTIIMALFLILALFVLRGLFMQVTGQEQVTPALVLAALMAGALFQPGRRRLRRFIDRHLYGIEIDYEKAADRARREKKEEPAPAETTLGAYRVMELIGRGGMADVYRGQHPTLERTVAIKMLRAEEASRENFRARFEREARAIASLHHPNIVEIYDFGVGEDTSYMVMEYIEGMSLSEYLKENGRLPLVEAIALITEIAAALDYAHDQGVVHRDVKPANVMLKPTTAASIGLYRPILTDFGIAKMMGGNTALTKTGMVGTLDYISPEQIQDAKEVDGRSDVYSLGVVAYQMITGHLPFKGNNPAAVLIAHLQQPPPDPRTHRPDLPLEIGCALASALAKNPDDRFATAGGFAGHLTPQPVTP